MRLNWVMNLRYQVFFVLTFAVSSGLFSMACAEDDRPATWSYIHATIIGPSCATANCHSDLAHVKDINLDNKDTAYQTLVAASCENGPDSSGNEPGDFVFPKQPENSKLMYQLRGIETRTMPPDLPLPEADIKLIEKWILEGAECN